MALAEPTSVAMLGTSPARVALFVGGVILLFYLFYRWALPKPIPGIPYNKDAANSILGDLPAMLSHMSATDQIFPWISAQNVKLNSPIVQVFTRPLQKPWVIITDFRESQDILLRRTREFDRSDFVGNVFVGLVPDFHISKKSSDEQFKRNRHLMKDLMTPGFLNQVAAPQIYSNIQTLLDLWSVKMRLAKGHPFAASKDIYYDTLDVIFAATFGLDAKDSTTAAQLRLLSMTDVKTPASIDQPIEFPVAGRPPTFDAILTLTESLEASVKSPFPLLHHWFLRQMPYMRKARAYKESYIAAELEKGVKRFQADNQVKRCALDDILHREFSLAKKENRTPAYRSRTIFDELFGFLIGGHDTTSTTVTWALKNLADTPDAQNSLRSHLRKAYAAATAERRAPTVDEITKIQIPYLDATIEEVCRTALTFPGVMRNALVDATVLGHHIPKGTDLFLLANGPGYLSTPYPIPEERRSESARTAKSQVGSWDSSDMREFKPERWLVKDEAGNEVYNATAGPHLAFGLGPRACYGRRLAYLELRIILVMIIWTFELKKCPKELNSYDAVDVLSRQAKQCYVRLEKAEW